MSNLGGVRNTVGDGGLGTVPASVENEMVVFGVAKGGTPNTVYSYSDKDDALEDLERGPLAQAAAYLLGTGAIKVVPVTSDVAGVASAVTKVGDGPDVTVAGEPNDAYSVVVVITKAGALGAGEFKYSLNGNVANPKYSGTFQIPAGGDYEIPGTDLTFTFGVGLYGLGTTYSTDCTAPGFTTTELNAAVDAYLATPFQASLFFVVGTPADAAETVDLVTALQAKLTAAETAKRFIRAFVEAADDSDVNLLTATINTVAKRVVCSGGFVELYSDVDGAFYKRSGAWTMARRALGTKVNTHIGRVKDGTLDGVRALLRDERVTPGLGNDQARFCVLRTYVEKAGFYVEDDYTMAPQGSDFSQLRNGRVMDKALRIAGAFLIDLVHDDFELQPNGTLAEHEVRRIEEYVGQGIKNGVVDAGNASASRFVVNRTTDFGATRTIRCKTLIQIRPDAKWIDHDITLTRTVSE
jgi:hypothetical protein